MRVKEDGTEDRPANDHAIIQVMSVSPDGQWAMAGVASGGSPRSRRNSYAGAAAERRGAGDAL